MKNSVPIETSLRLVQDLKLECISKIRDEITGIFGSVAHANSETDTLWAMLKFMSSRSQSICLLISNESHWDAEIIMRSFYESVVKIAFICFAKSEDKAELAEEFWVGLRKVHANQQKNRAEIASHFFQRAGDKDSQRIFDHMQDEGVFDFRSENKSERKKLKQKWSFSEIVMDLEKRSSDGLPTVGIQALLHMYGVQSHLIHADSKGIEFVIDDECRSPSERKIKNEAHLVRQMSDLVHLWVYCLMAIQYNFDAKEKNSDLSRSLAEFDRYSKPFLTRFHRSQDDFYNGWKSN